MGLTSVEPVGYLHDGESTDQSEWSQAQILALQECRAFVALCSPDFFASDARGREWTFFAARTAQRRRATDRPRAMIPLFWQWSVPPDCVTSIYYDDPLFGPTYREHGLRRLLEPEHRDDYVEFVTVVGARLTKVARADPPPRLCPVPSLDSTANAFAPPPAPGPTSPLLRLDE